MRSLHTPARNNKGICQTGKIPFNSPVVKSYLQYTPTSAVNTLDKTNCKSVSGAITFGDYVTSHENLEKVHLNIECTSLQIEEHLDYGQKFPRKLPPNRKHCKNNTARNMTLSAITHLQNSDTLYYNHKVQLSQEETHFSNFSMYPTN